MKVFLFNGVENNVIKKIALIKRYLQHISHNESASRKRLKRFSILPKSNEDAKTCKSMVLDIVMEFIIYLHILRCKYMQIVTGKNIGTNYLVKFSTKYGNRTSQKYWCDVIEIWYYVKQNVKVERHSRNNHNFYFSCKKFIVYLFCLNLLPHTTNLHRMSL